MRTSRDFGSDAPLPEVPGGTSERPVQGRAARIYDDNAALVYGLLLRILGEPLRAERVLTRVFRDASALDPAAAPGEITAWLVRRARQVALAESTGATPPPRTPAAGTHVVPFCKDSRRVARIQANLARLAPLDREMLEQVYFGGVATATLAAKFGLEESAVRARLRQALGNVSQERAPRSKEATT